MGDNGHQEYENPEIESLTIFIADSQPLYRQAIRHVLDEDIEIVGESELTADIWKTIDHILLSPGMFNGKGFEYESFRVFKDDFLLNTWGYPLSWRTETGYGYSDHLPILLVVKQ